MDIETHPEYRAGLAEFQAATLVATQASDEMGKLKAELAWVRKEQEIRSRVSSEALQQEKRDLAIAKVKEDYPLVPPSMYEAIADPDQLLAVAADIQKNLDAQVRRNTNSWGGASGAPGGTSGKPAKLKSADQQYVNDLINRVNKNEGGAKGAVKEYKDMVWKERVTPWRESMQGRSK